MASRDTAKSRTRTRINRIAVELSHLREREMQLNSERRKASLKLGDALLGWWVTGDIERRRWNTGPGHVPPQSPA
jgi:hypothetical protein